jgi:hypothetical protein
MESPIKIALPPPGMDGPKLFTKKILGANFGQINDER